MNFRDRVSKGNVWMKRGGETREEDILEGTASQREREGKTG